MNKVAFHTLGCKLNFSETSSIARSCEDKGYEKVEFKEKANIYVLNTALSQKMQIKNVNVWFVKY